MNLFRLNDKLAVGLWVYAGGWMEEGTESDFLDEVSVLFFINFRFHSTEKDVVGPFLMIGIYTRMVKQKCKL